MIYIVGHLVGYVLLVIVLRRAGAVPAWLLVASTRLTLAVFLRPGRPIALGDAALVLVLIASNPRTRP